MLTKYNTDPLVQRILEEQTIIIGPLDGVRRIAGLAGQNLFAHIDIAFIAAFKENAEKKTVNRPTPQTNFEVHEQVGEATFKSLFAKVNKDLKKLAVTEDQLIELVERYRSLFYFGNYSVTDLLLAESGVDLSVVTIYAKDELGKTSTELGVYRNPIEYSLVHSVKYPRRIMVPCC